ncbi:glutathione peroxidase [Bacteroidota bacterium]
MNKNLYDFEVSSINGEKITMSKYKDNVMLIVNTASKCGFTPQFDGLQKLYEKYSDKGFTILGFPCNQFKDQEPGNAEEIKNFCSLNYNVTFPMFAKIDVNGESADPLYKYLKNDAKGFLSKKIKWNFTKFLVDREGNIVKRFSPSTEPAKIEKYITNLL